MKKLPFKSNAFDQLHKEIKGCSLDWSAKALITHVINWQIKTNKITGQQCVCTESNATIARQLGMSPSTLSKLITRLNRETTFFRSEKISKQRTGGYFNATKKTVDIPKLLQWLELETNWWLDRYERELTEADLAVLTHEEAVVDQKDGDLTSTTGEEKQVQQSPVIGQQLRTTENMNVAEATSYEILDDRFDCSRESTSDTAEAPVQVVPSLLKGRVTAEDADNFFFQLIEEDGNLFSDVVYGTDEQADVLIRAALMNRPNLGAHEKIVYNEWVADFVQSNLPRLREFIKNYQQKQSA